MKNAVVNGRKRKQIQINLTDKNKEQVDFVHKPNEHLIVELINLTIGLFIIFMNGLLNRQTKSFFHSWIY